MEAKKDVEKDTGDESARQEKPADTAKPADAVEKPVLQVRIGSDSCGICN